MLTVFKLEQAERWDAVVRSFQQFDVYWLSGYVKAFQIHGDGEPLLFYYDDNLTRGINVVMMRDVAEDERFEGKLPKGCYFDFVTPYGYGGWIIEGEGVDDLFLSYDAWIRKNGIISEFVRFHPMVKNHNSCSAYYHVQMLGEVVHIDLSSPEGIWSNFVSTNRTATRKAIKNGVKIYNGRFPAIFKEFRAIYDRTMDKDRADAYYYFEEPFYTSILNDLPQNAQVFWAEKDDTVIAAAIMIYANHYMNYHLSGSLSEYGSLRPANLLIYEAALWGSANGYRSLYLGGGVGSERDNLFAFKRTFYKGELNRFFIGKRIHDAQKYNDLVQMRGEIHSTFFPLYRAGFERVKEQT